MSQRVTLGLKSSVLRGVLIGFILNAMVTLGCDSSRRLNMRLYLLAAATFLAVVHFASAQAPSTAVPIGPSSERFIRLGDTGQLSSNIVGLNVYNNKDNIGEIKDIAMDNSGVRAYILSVGGFLGMGAHYVAVVPREINIGYDAGDKKWHANMTATKAELLAAPEFKYEGRWQ